jgi:alanine racemase
MRFAGTRLTIDLGALVANWRFLQTLVPNAEVGATVKADAYGCGLEYVGRALFEAGCRSFFVALLEEGIELRRALRQYEKGSDAAIYVLDGPLGEVDCVMSMLESSLFPVVSSELQAEKIERILSARSARLPLAIHIDTGMNRLGIRAEHLNQFLQTDLRAKLHVTLLMSHLACGDEPDHPLNAQQLQRFAKCREMMPDTRASLANSAGHFLEGFSFDLTRPGIALYGGRCLTFGPNQMKPVVKAEARIIQQRHAKQGEAVGYGASHLLARDSVLAVCGAGYADGYLRAVGGGEAFAFYGGQKVPILGRVSMDLLTVDITDIPEAKRQGEWVELFGENILLDDVADAGGTIGYELLTGLSRRASRTYLPHQ